MRAGSVAMYGQALVACSLLSSAGLFAADTSSTAPENRAPAFISITNVGQLSGLDSAAADTVFAVRLEGNVWWANAAQGRLLLQDGTGAEELQLDFGGAAVRAGSRVRIEGVGAVIRRGAAVRLGLKGPVVDNDGVHRAQEVSGSVYLSAGRHPLRLDWFNATGKPGLDVAYEGPRISRQKIPDGVLLRAPAADEAPGTNLLEGVAFRAYEGTWDYLPDFSALAPVKTGTVVNFNLRASRSRDRGAGVQFTAILDVPRDGLYTFYVRSAAGSRLFVGESSMRLTVLGDSSVPTPIPFTAGQELDVDGGQWAETSGRVTLVREEADGLELELGSGAGRMRLEIGDSAGLFSAVLLGRRIQVRGFCQTALTAEGLRVAGKLLVPSAKEIQFLEPVSEPEVAGTTPSETQTLPVLTTANAVRHLTREQARRGYPAKLQGVVTCVQADHQAFVLQDSTMGLFVFDSSSKRGELPVAGDFVAIEGRTDEPALVRAGSVKRLGAGAMPEPLHPDWDQLLNGSMDSQCVEIRGLVESLVNRSNGWSRVNLRTGAGLLRVDLRRDGVKPGPPERYENAAIRLRGCIFADWQPDTLRLKVGQIRMYDADVIVDQPAPPDLFSIPTETAASLKKFDPTIDAARSVKVAGQIVFVRGADYFMMDGAEGLRFMAKEPLGLAAGDLVEAVGFPQLSGAATVLRGAVARKTGHAPLPAPSKVAPGDLTNLAYDSTRVQVEGVLASVKHTPDNEVLEMQSGSWRFLARLNTNGAPVRPFRIGSKLQLVGVYCAQGGYSALGSDVVPLDVLINSAADIKVLTTPTWWTLQRLLVVVGALALAVILAALWIHQLRRKVEIRTRQLEEQIKERERVEHLRAMEQERARIAQDLHDELGSDITEIGMLAARARSISGSDAERSAHLGQMGEKARQMVDALEEIVWAMNPSHDSLDSLVSYFSFYAERFLGLANINWQLDDTPASSACRLDSRRRHELFLAFKEALTNVVRHSGATQVRLGIHANNGDLRVIITDNGHGLPAAGVGQGMDGIANMKARIENLGGRFAIGSENGHGTTVTLSVPSN